MPAVRSGLPHGSLSQHWVAPARPIKLYTESTASGGRRGHKPTVPVRIRLAPGRRSLRGRTELAVVAVTNTISMFRQ